MQPALGRLFTNEEDQEGRGQVAILSHEFWQSRFGGDSNTLNRTITLNDQPYTVVGIMPPGFAFPETRTQVWMPVAFNSAERATRDTNFIDVIARLKPVFRSSRRARTWTRSRKAGRTLSENEHRGRCRRSCRCTSKQSATSGRCSSCCSARSLSFLLIACANVANLLLARAAARQREMAIRGALGASRSRVVRSASHRKRGAGGRWAARSDLLLAIWSLDLLVSLKPANLPRLAEIGINRTVFVFTFAISVITGIVFGLVPAFQASKPDLNEGLKDSSRGATAARGGTGARALLVVSEIALSLVLLVGAGLMIRSFARLLAVDPGFKADHVLTAFVSLPVSKYPRGEEQAAFFERLIERLRNLPGVSSAGVVTRHAAFRRQLDRIRNRWPPPSLPGQRPHDGLSLDQLPIISPRWE